MTRLHSEMAPEKLQDLWKLCSITPRGAVLEIGVYKGGSAQGLYEIAKRKGDKLHLFDTFTGIPVQDMLLDVLPIGKFDDVSTKDMKKLIMAMPEAVLHIGLFPDTWPDFYYKNDSKISFANVDCDQYETCKAAIDLIWPLLCEGGIIAFDDYPSFPGIRKAVDDRFGGHPQFGGSVRTTKNEVPFVVKSLNKDIYK